MHALRQEILPPSGVEFAASLKFTPSTLSPVRPTSSNSTTRHEFTARSLCHLVVARSNLLRIFEIREEPAPILFHVDDERERRSKVRRGTEPVEGEVEMDEQGEGFVNMGSVKVIFRILCPVIPWTQFKIVSTSKDVPTKLLTNTLCLPSLQARPHPQLLPAFTSCVSIVCMALLRG